MEKRIGAVVVLIEDKSIVPSVNTLLSSYSDIIYGRQGLPLRERGIHVISLIVEGTTDEIGALTGKLGRLRGVQVKSILTRYKEPTYELSSSQGTEEPLDHR